MIQHLVLNWVKCDGGAWSELAPNARWCALESVDLSSITEPGVYVIWVAGRCVYVGQGRIADRLAEHRSLSADASWEILGYRRYGTLGVTWASVDEQRQGRHRGVPRRRLQAARGLPAPRRPAHSRQLALRVEGSGPAALNT